jgi:hypothetical protein
MCLNIRLIFGYKKLSRVRQFLETLGCALALGSAGAQEGPGVVL